MEVLELERGEALKIGESQRLDHRQTLEAPPDLELVAQPVDVPRTTVLRIEYLEDDWCSVGHPHRAVDGDSLAPMQLLAQSVCLRRYCHSGFRRTSLRTTPPRQSCVREFTKSKHTRQRLPSRKADRNVTGELGVEQPAHSVAVFFKRTRRPR